ncbi:unnamed protein product [Menidia menidia]|uniref:(Atlantic silverside) hypothetical protein n=1 Tax=Menidia menidia TaxID=238744 RepID=A0A8S4AFT5_9TELE|nr:unnamed protein product [Menidia menidia]
MDWSQSSQGKHNVFAWFTENQLQSVIRNGIIPEWFHGIISRKTAEELLMSKPPGYFLIRVSETRIGYTLSYRVEERCRHFMVDVLDDGQYVIVGESRRHQSLQELVDFHRRTPILPCNQVLTVACGQSQNGHTNYAELLFPQKHPVSNASVQQSQPPPSSGHSESQGDVPPAVPYRPDNLRTPHSLQNRLYPRLEDDFQHISSPLPPMPVPMIRRSQATDNPPLSNPPPSPRSELSP